MFWYSLGLSVTLFLVFNVLAIRSGSLFRSLLLAIIVCPVGFLACLSWPLAVHAFCLAVAAAIMGFFVERGRGLLIGSSLATLVAWAGVGYIIVREDQPEWEKARADNPVESLSSRLAYEKLPGRKPSPLPDEKERRYQTTQSHLADIEGGLKTWVAVLRTDSLKLAHAGTVRQFVNSPGFGVGRQIMIPRANWAKPPFKWNRELPLPPITDVTLFFDPTDTEETYPPPLGVSPLPVASTTDNLWQIHRGGVLEFLDAEGFGYARDRDHVAGFLPHRFRQIPDTWNLHRSHTKWRVERLELVSLLKHDKPGVYVSESLPRMDRIGELTVRPLDTFESSTLPLLQSGEDLAKELNGSDLRVLGSIRATQQCLKCHDVQRGDLLGAFTYKLRRESSAP